MKQSKCMLLCLFVCFLSACSSMGGESDYPTPAPAEPQPPEVIEVLAQETPAQTTGPIATETPMPMATDSSLRPFTIAWVSDTQHYSELYPEYLTSMTKWVSDHRQEFNIQAFVHTGDMVNRSGSGRQWDNLSSALDLLGDLPLLAVAGNHDVGTKTLDYSYFVEHIASRYQHPELMFEKGRGYALRLNMESLSVLLIGTGWGFSDESVAWLNDTIRQYPNDFVILCVHSYMDTNTHLTDGGKIIFDQVVKPNYGVKLVLCGHRDGVALRQDPLDLNGDGTVERTVVTMMYNYQEVKKDGGGGYLRLLTVDPASRSLEVKTYSPYFDVYKTDPTEQFTIENLY